MEIDLFSPREHQREVYDHLERFNVLVCHRRWGKTVFCINYLIRKALENDLPRPRYAYIAPLRIQAKQAAWDYLKAYTEPIPNVTSYESELRSDLPGERRVQLFGSDNPDAIRGIYLDGVILDEYAQMPPRLWGEVIRPLLTDRKGWAIFIGTPQGHNQFYDLFQNATKGFPIRDSSLREIDADWYGVMYKASETGIIDREELSAAEREMSEEEYAQEFECSFEAAIRGAYYGKLMENIVDQITAVPYDPAVPVNTCWDLGIGDDTAIWFFQMVGKEIHWIDFYSNSGMGLQHYVSMIRQRPVEWGYPDVIWGEHLLPHDAEARELGTGVTRVETLQSLDLMGIRVIRRQNLDDGINACRNKIPVSWFDEQKCITGIEALKQYRRDFDDKKGVFLNSPRHDWSSHAADAFRTGCVGMQPPMKKRVINYGREWVV